MNFKIGDAELLLLFRIFILLACLHGLEIYYYSQTHPANVVFLRANANPRVSRRIERVVLVLGAQTQPLRAAAAAAVLAAYRTRAFAHDG